MTVTDAYLLAQQRREALDEARHEARLEGLRVHPAFEGLLKRYEDGELSADEVVERLKTAPLE